MSKQTFQKKLYNRFVLPTVYGALSVASLFHGKLRETFAARKDIRNRWESSGICFEKHPVWFHVSSVGEYEQAKPVISQLARRYPDIPVVITFTSPSGYKYATQKENVGEGSNIKFIEYLPLDFAGNARFCLGFLNPRLLVFVKFDLWPNLVWEAAARRVPIMLIDATLSESSHRLSRPGRSFYRAVYSDLDKILAISSRDAERFGRCVPNHPGISIVGDTRFDRVLERKQLGKGPEPELSESDSFVVIAGSTWPKDEERLLPALARLAQGSQPLLIVIAPHEPTYDRVEGLLAWARSSGIEAARLSDQRAAPSANGGPRVLVLDSVGHLAETYRHADVAYIGGSFSSGVHSVIEPAIMGIPVLFGPVHKNSFEALELLRHGAAARVDDSTAIHERLTAIQRNEELRRSMGARATTYVESQLGATDRCMESMAEYLQPEDH